MSKSWTEIQHGDFNAADQRLWVALGNHAEDVATRINTDPTFVANVARFMMNGGYEPTTSQRIAREIMGKNFFGPQEALKHFGVKAKKQELAALAEVPFSEEVLQSSKDTHILVAVFPLSLLDVRGIARKVEDKTLFYSQDWYEKQTFAREKGKLGWHLLRKEPVANSLSKNWEEQQALLSKEEEIPKARIVVYTMVGHFLESGERLFEKVYVRCSDLDSDGDRVRVGDFDSGGLYVGSRWDDRRSDRLGLAVARK